MHEFDDANLNRAGRRAAGRRTRRVGAAMTAGTAALGGAAAVLASTAAPAGALVTYEVSNNNDSGAGSLRQAMIDAETDGDDSQITFAANVTGTIPVSSQLEIDGDGNLTIIGPGSGVLSLVGDGGNRILYMDGSWSGDVASVSGLTLTGGQASAGGGIKFYDCGDCDLVLDDVVITQNTATGEGAGIQFYGSGDLTITDSVISQNTAGEAAGINFYDSGSLTMTRTTVSGNTATTGWAGGLYFYNADSLTIIASTFSDNSAAGGGGAMWIGGNTRPGPVLIANSTFTGNRAVGDGGAIAMEYGDLQLLQSTISGNDAGSDVGDGLYLEGPSAGGGSAEAAGRGRATPAATKEDGTPKDPKDPQPEGVAPQIVDEPVEITGTIISGNAGTDIGTSDSKAVAVASTNNLIGTVTAGISLASVETIMSSTPGLGPLASNGGPTQTMALLLGSPALNAGPTTVPAFPGNETDQRGAGYPRVSGGRVDIGAYEYQVPEPSFTG